MNTETIEQLRETWSEYGWTFIGTPALNNFVEVLFERIDRAGNFNDHNPAISAGTLGRVRAIIRQHDRSKNYLDLARAEVIDTLRQIDRENEGWEVLVPSPTE